MKLHLPKMLLTAVLAACVAPAWAETDESTTSGWGILWDDWNNRYTLDSYAIGDDTITSIDTADSEQSTGNLFIRSNNGISESEVGTLTVTGRNLTIDGWYNTDVNHPEFSSLTITTANVSSGATLNIAANNTVTIGKLVSTNGDNEITGNSTISDVLELKNGGSVSFTSGTHNIAKMDIHCQNNVYLTETLSIVGATVNVTGTDNTDHLNDDTSGAAAVTIGHWNNGKGAVIVGGESSSASTFNVLGGTIRMSYNTSSELSIKQNGTVNAMGIQFSNFNDGHDTDDAVIKLEGGRLNLGSGGLSANTSKTNCNYKRELNLNSGTLGALAETVTIAAGTTKIGGAFVIDTAVVDATGAQIDDKTAAVTFSNGVELTADATLTIKGGGSVSFGTSTLAKTLTITIEDDTNLTFAGITVDALDHQLQLVGTSKVWYTNDGTTQSSNGYRVDESTYTLFKGYAWNGSVSGYTVDTSTGDTRLITDKTPSTVYFVNSGKVNTSAVSGATGFRVYSIKGQDTGNLIISGDVGDTSASTLLSTTEGNGKITLETDVQLNNASTVATGNLTIGDGTTMRTLTVGGGKNTDDNSYKNNTANIGSFTSVTLDKGTIAHNAKNNTIQNLTVTTNGGELYIRDQSLDTPISLAGKTTLNGDLSIGTRWKYNLNIAALTGAGNLIAESYGSSNNDTATVTIGSLQGYTGTISMTKGTGPATLNATTGGAVSLKGLTLANGATGSITATGNTSLGDVSLSGGATLTLEATDTSKVSMTGLTLANGTTGSITATGNISLGDVSLSGGATLTLEATDASKVSMTGLTLANGTAGNITAKCDAGLGSVSLTEGSTLSILNSGKTRTTTITSLSVTGSATVGTVRSSSCYNGTFDISSLSNTGDSATLTLKNGSQTDDATVYNLSGTSSMKGTINIQADSFRGNTDMSVADKSRKLQVNLKSTAVAEKAVINFQDATTLGDKDGSGTTNNVRSNYNILGVDVEGAKVAGLSGTTTNAATVKSTNSTARTLELAVASGSYTTNATIDATVKLKKTGAGTQTLTGTVSSKDITVGAGELILSKEITVEKLAMTGGVLTVGTYTGEELTENTLTVTSSASFGAGAKVNANLVLSNNTQLTLDGALTMGSTLKLGTGITLSGSLVDGLNDLEEGQSIALFSGVDSLTLGTDPATTGVITLDDGIKANGYFTDLADDLMLTYTGGKDASLSITKMVSPVTPNVPEPTTATLSLLALAGLAARRRRK